MSISISTRRRAGCLVMLLVCLFLPSLGRRAEAAEIRVGLANTSSDAAFFIADKKKYFREEGVSVTFIPFDTGSKMIAPLSTGQLEVGAAAPSSALYNAVARGVDLRIVADKGQTPPGYGYQPLLVRKDLWDGGRIRTLSDLKGRKIAAGGVGISTSVTLNEALVKGGLTMSDVSAVTMGYPQHMVALQNGAVDASLTVEPTATLAINNGVAVRMMGDDEIYPYHQLSVVFFSADFIKKRPKEAKGFIRAYIRAVRDYNDALRDGRLGGPNADEIVAILTEYSVIKDGAILRAMISHGYDPDARLNVASLKKDLDYFKSQGLIQGDVSIENVVDSSLVEGALADLGPHKKRQ